MIAGILYQKSDENKEILMYKMISETLAMFMYDLSHWTLASKYGATVRNVRLTVLKQKYKF